MASDAATVVHSNQAVTDLHRGLGRARRRVRLLLAVRLATLGIAVLAGAAEQRPQQAVNRRIVGHKQYGLARIGQGFFLLIDSGQA